MMRPGLCVYCRLTGGKARRRSLLEPGRQPLPAAETAGLLPPTGFRFQLSHGLSSADVSSIEDSSVSDMGVRGGVGERRFEALLSTGVFSATGGI
ncbi:hypothetical protein TNIN_274211 [Trichonephila inaurata madagascariensis]|uniref:Uncharacterized protein n=1 Tax=Trichonephila inaurata madagascariensis TaxID=2747483 RepID=A0A8X6JS93_9ARAC|nr:hypothetical protein TNIN_274211 [Trichonephila inaurata madagascariensis]